MKLTIHLNPLESTFFERLLQVQLDVPVNASLTYQDEILEMIVVPRIRDDGDFVMEYFNATPYSPVAVEGVVSLTGNSMSGTHPLLEKAWLSDDPVFLELRISQSLPPSQTTVPVRAKVVVAGGNHSGIVALWENGISRNVQPIGESRFNLVGFPDFFVGNNLYDRIIINRILQPVSDQLPEGWTVSARPPQRKLVLQTGCGWNIDICRQDDHLRGMVNHEGVITRTDGSEYGIDDLEALLDGLKNFFAFVVGDYRHPTVVIGYSRNKSPSWGQIGRFSDTLSPRMNWFKNNYTPLTSKFLEVLFPKFWEKWSEKSREISESMDLYVRSTHTQRNGNPIGALAESYAALETLASLTSGETIRGESHKEIDQALKKNKVPLRMVNANSLNTSYFSEACDKLNIGCYKGVYLLNEVRNYVPHPLEPKTNAEIKPEVHEFLHKNRVPLAFLHDLSQFYFEHLFLAYCGPEFTPVKLGHGRFRQLLAEINAVPD